MTGQQALFDVPPDVLWCVPVDRYGRDLPPIAILGADWHGLATWGCVATDAAERLGPDATLQQLYDASTGARHLFYALTGDRQRLELELNHYRGSDG